MEYLLADRAEEEPGELAPAPGADDDHVGTFRRGDQCPGSAVAHEDRLDPRPPGRGTPDGRVEEAAGLLFNLDGGRQGQRVDRVAVRIGHPPGVHHVDGGVAQASLFEGPAQGVASGTGAVHADDNPRSGALGVPLSAGRLVMSQDHHRAAGVLGALLAD